MSWLDTPTNAATPAAIKKKVDRFTPHKISEITSELPGLGEASAQAVTPPQHNQFAERPLAGMVQPVLPHENRRVHGKGEASMILKTKSAILLSVLGAARRSANGDTSILILGESGTGKTTLAQEVHGWGGRKGKFIRVNCATLNPSLNGSELFGHIARALTGAGEAKRGAIDEAEGGTLFLDEIGELGLDLQKNLLDLLDDKTFSAIGSHAKKTADVRIIAATHCDVDAMVAAKTFRLDLFHRFGRVLTMPSLRDRAEDMMDLIGAMCAAQGWTVSDEALDYLRFGSYPGNIRQLANVLREAHTDGWGKAEALAAVTKMGRAPVLARPRLIAEDRLSVARELSASRASVGGWWTAAELADASDAAKRTINTDLRGWLEAGEVERKGAGKCAQYRADARNGTNQREVKAAGGEA